MNGVRALLQYHSYLAGGSRIVLWWYTPFSVLGAMLVGVACMGTAAAGGPSSRSAEAVVCSVSSLTFPVYVVHQHVIRLLSSREVLGAVQSTAFRAPTGRSLLYVVVSTLLVFCVSLALCECIRRLAAACISIMCGRAAQRHIEER